MNRTVVWFSAPGCALSQIILCPGSLRAKISRWEEDRKKKTEMMMAGSPNPLPPKMLCSFLLGNLLFSLEGYTTHFHPNSILPEDWSFVGSCFYPTLQTLPLQWTPSRLSHSFVTYCTFFLNFYLYKHTEVCVQPGMCICMQINPTINTSIEGRDSIHS